MHPARRVLRKSRRTGRYLRMALQYRVARAANGLPRPVFIVCQNRSGSTFLNQLLGAHPQCWTYREGSHQEAMDQEDCPRWLSRQPFLYRWRITTPSRIERWQTPLWLAAMASGHRCGVFKIPHALAKVAALQELLPDARFVLLVRHPAAQVTSALATGNPIANVQVTAEVLERFLRYEADHVRHLTQLRYEDLLEQPQRTLAQLCEAIELDSNPAWIQACIEAVGIRPGRGADLRAVPEWAHGQVERLCHLLDYPLAPREGACVGDASCG